MSTPRGTVHALLDGLRTVLGALSGRLTVEEAPDFFADLGVAMTPEQAVALAGPLDTFRGSVTDFVHRMNDLDQALTAGNAQVVAQGEVAATAALGQVLGGLPALASGIGGLPGVSPDVVAALPGRLVNHLFTGYFGHFPGLNEILEFTGVLRRDDIEPAAGVPFHTIDTFDLGTFGGWLADPGKELATRFDWGAPGFDGTKLLRALGKLIATVGLPVLVDESGPAPVLDLIDVRIVPRTDLVPPGVALVFDSDAEPLVYEFARADMKTVLSVGFSLARGTEVLIQPNGAVTVVPPAGTTTPGGAIRFAYTVIGDGRPMILLGGAGGSRLEAGEITFFAEVSLRGDGAGAAGSVGVGGAVRGGKVVLDLSGGDGFLSTILPAARVENDFEVEFGYSAGAGLHFRGSSTLDIKLPVHLELGAAEISAVTLSLQVRGKEFPLYVTADVKASLGPVTAVVEGVGIGAALAFADGNDGNLGPVDVRFTARPPRGAGLSIDAGVVTGGGYLHYNPERGEYAGALELELAGFIDVKAIGLISTRMPDGSKGFSLLIVMAAEFGFGGIQLGYGFTLLAVGGLIGLNRRMNLTALAEGVRTGAVESLMFPRDVVADAPRILSDLRTFFPPQDGTFLIGPMAKIGWGTPTLISISVGVILEIPGNIAIVGLLRVALPTVDAPLLILQVAFIGAVEFDKQRFWFFAAMFDSRVLFMTIDGEMGVLAAWGDDANLVVSVGGFHPAFRPPPLPFPVPRRISIDILNQPGRLLRVSGYFAVTSNTVQFGARAELRLGFSDFGLEGHLAFDALFRFSPFSFIIEISAALSLKAFGVGLFGIRLQFALEGPAPWRARGRGSISLLFFEISADFDLTWGEERNTTLPPVDVLPLLAAEIVKTEGWETRLPAGGAPLVTLRPLTGADDLVLHPRGTLFVRQRALPLRLRLDRVGAQRPRDVTTLSVTVITPGLAVRADTVERFAIAQFQDMDDAAKLSRAAFEPQPAGVELAPDGDPLASSRVVKRSARYEQNIIDVERATPEPPARFQEISPVLFGHLLDGNSVSRSPLSAAQAALREPAGSAIRSAGDRFAIARAHDNSLFFPAGGGVADFGDLAAPQGGPALVFGSESAAAGILDHLHDTFPDLIGTIHVIPLAEVVGAPL